MIATAHNRAGVLALEIYRDVLNAVRGDRLMRDAIRLQAEKLEVQDIVLDLNQFENVFLCGAGKASFGMAQYLAELLGERVSGGIVVTKEGHGGTIPGLEVVESSHPVPDDTSLDAGRRLLAFARQTGPNDLVLFALSGGASSLTEFPIEGVSLQDLQVLNRFLLASGFGIEQMNAIRSAISQTKHGGLGQAFLPSRVVVLVLSDVMGDNLDAIGSGPFWNSQSLEEIPVGVGSYWDNRTAFVASEFCGKPLSRLGIKIDDEYLSELLDRATTATRPPEADLSRRVSHRFIGSSQTARLVARRSAVARGLRIDESGAEPLVSDARVEGEKVARLALCLGSEDSICAIFGGEPTVILRGNGSGGRCQELACVASGLISGRSDLAILAGSTDGTDGPTDVAGALVDGYSTARARAQGIDAETCLASSDSQLFLEACGGLIRTGPTQSNVNDVVLMIRADCA